MAAPKDVQKKADERVKETAAEYKKQRDRYNNGVGTAAEVRDAADRAAMAQRARDAVNRKYP